MKHLYQIYEAYPDGTLHDTSKTLSLDPVSSAEVLTALFSLFGFTQFVNYFSVYFEADDSIKIKTRFHEGLKTTWVLKKGV
jgi:hypothetical protein